MMEIKSSIAQHKGKAFAFIMFLLLCFVLLALMELLPDSLSSKRVVADRYCRDKGFMEALKYGYDISDQLIIVCQNMTYELVEKGDMNITSVKKTYYLEERI